MDEKIVCEMLRQAGLKETDINEKLAILRQDAEVPVTLIGIGQTGVGKTELIRSIFRLRRDDVEELEQFRTNPIRSETGAFRNLDTEKPIPRDALFLSVCVTSPHGLKVQFTDGPGLGESTEDDHFFVRKWIDEIPAHDLLYWVVDGSSRDVAHIQQNMKIILDATGYRDRLVVVLNNVDQILLPMDSELAGEIGWSNEYNVPSDALENLIHERAADVIEKLSTVVEIEADRIVYCSARKRWNHDVVLDTLLENLPETKRLKASLNRHVASAKDLMSERWPAPILCTSRYVSPGTVNGKG